MACQPLLLRDAEYKQPQFLFVVCLQTILAIQNHGNNQQTSCFDDTHSNSYSRKWENEHTVHWSNFGVRRATLKPELEHGKQNWSQGWEHKAAQQMI